MQNSPLLRFVPLLFVVLWSTGFIGAKYSMPYAEPATLLGIRMGIAAILILIISRFYNTHWPDKYGAMHSMVVGALVHATYLGCVFVAIKDGMPAGVAALIVGMQPILVAVLAVIWFSDRLTSQQVAGLLLGLIGVSLVIIFRQPNAVSATFSTYSLVMALIAVCGISVGSLYQKHYCSNVSLLATTFYQYVSTAIIMGIMAFTFETRVIEWNGQLVLALIWLILVLSLAAVLLLMFMIREGKATTVASYFYLTPAFTALIAWFLFDERPGAMALVGIVIASSGVYLARNRL